VKFDRGRLIVQAQEKLTPHDYGNRVRRDRADIAGNGTAAGSTGDGGWPSMPH